MVQLLQLMQLSDGTLPIGAVAHSFGLESLAEWSVVTPASLESFLHGYLEQQAPLECLNVRAGFTARITRQSPAPFCRRLDAIRQASESREASVSLGRRFLTLCSKILPIDAAGSLESAFRKESAHHVLVFGYVGALLDFDQDETVAAFLHQAIAAIISSAQRLIQVGQRQATALQWTLKPAIVSVVETTRNQDIDSAGSFMPFLDIASMRHPQLETRLFLS